MKLNRTRLLLTLALFSQTTFAYHHADAPIFDQKVIHFEEIIDAAPMAMPAQPKSYVSVVKQQGSSALFEAKLTSLTIGKVKLADGNIYNRILLPDGGSPSEPGQPNLTGYQQMIRIPDGAQVEIIVENIEWSETFNDIMIDPVQLPLPDSVNDDGTRPDKNMPFVKNENAYQIVTDSAPSPVSIIETIRVRGKSYAVISYRPIDFNPINETVRFAKKVRFHVNYVLPDSKTQKREDKLDFDAPSNSVIDLRSEAEQKNDAFDTPSRQEKYQTFSLAQQADYLIITADEFRNAIEPLADWKRKKGYKVHVATLTETGNTQEQIKAYIKNAYEHGPMTSYVLFVGDHENVPSYEIIGHPFHHGKNNHRWHSDYEYALVDGSDKFADLVIGRFPGDTEAQITHMVTRTLAYEKAPFDSDRYNHALLAGQFQDSDDHNLEADRLFMEVIHRVADFMGPDYDFFNGPGDLFNKGFQIHTALQWDADIKDKLEYKGATRLDYGSARIWPPKTVPQSWKDQGHGNHIEIADAINQGVGFVMHRDHGYGNGSGWADPRFVTQNVNALTNGNISPVVFSLNCATGWFDGKDSFAEAWMRNPNGGAVGFTGAVRISFSGFNDLLHAGIMDSFWDDYDGTWSSDIYPVSFRPAMSLNRAKERLFSHYGVHSDAAIMTAQFYSWFGDPELELRTERPKELTVTHPAEFANNGTTAAFNVAVHNSDERIQNARVALVSKSGDTYIGTTDVNGVAHFKLDNTEPMTVTVTEHNSKAYEGEIKVKGIQTAPVAHAGNDKTVSYSKWVALDATKSSSPEGKIISYKWTQIAGPAVEIVYSDESYAYALTPRYDATLKFQVTVTDDKGKSSSTTNTVIVKDRY